MNPGIETAVGISEPPARRADAPVPCFHGGEFFAAIGTEFDDLDRRHGIINADVLDAWFPPSPEVLAALAAELPWLLRTSPPTHGDGLVRVIARTRGVSPECVLAGAGSSDLIFLAFRQWLNRGSRVLLPDPAYGEYAHVIEKVVGGSLDRLALARQNQYELDPEQLRRQIHETQPDLLVLVNPNNPTGRHIPRGRLKKFLQSLPANLLVWLDETYVDYAGPEESLERFAAGSRNVVVCKSMSKAYALSGVRAAYLCGPARLLAELRGFAPPWSVSLPAQLAAVRALEDPEYYAARHAETRVLRHHLASELVRLPGWEIIPGTANFLLCHLPPTGPDAATIIRRCREQGLYLRDVRSMGRNLGDHVLRVAVKDADTNHRMLEILANAVGP